MRSFRQTGTVVTGHRFLVPLDHDAPDGPRIEVFAREVVATAHAGRGDLPWLLFLQGGPGYGGPRFAGREGWLDRALEDYRVLLLDQRGTGLSTPVTARRVAALGKPEEQARYLARFRADSIVLDAELVRRELLGDVPWTVLGQSFGGFCAHTYLSFAAEGVREALVTGGTPGLTATAEDVYRRTYPRVAAKNAAFYERYPDDVDLVRDIARRLAGHDERLPNGRRLTVEGFQSLGLMLGTGTGADRLHYLLELAFADGGPELSPVFLEEVGTHLSHTDAPIHIVLHEPLYAQGGQSTRWAAQRLRAEFPEFAPDPDGPGPLLFTGEMIYPWMVADDPSLAPLREAADLLAERADWPALYDPARLRGNEVPVSAAVYHDDMYVDFGLSMETIGAVPNARAWVTNKWEHDGLRVSGGKVLDRLIRMSRGEA
ncbi:alpha/beta fold hydrolase [Actinomadura rupiterrae]|uniref:alpha/beta fold hydrolase n=1 Tax=Actinomadura rupiterrae TaxID=559627 RepID=UPI0020A43BC0|nr:alpha/beta fold hydrolase [Actinomadura rupiterrae]MCP2338748.1 pimeloyl-ACP methyl ester carboxylesterase [Actinomadura rupiterrae]